MFGRVRRVKMTRGIPKSIQKFALNLTDRAIGFLSAGPQKVGDVRESKMGKLVEGYGH